MLERIKKAYDVLTKDTGEASIFVGGNVNTSILSLAENVTEGELIKHYKKSLYLFIGVDKIATVTSSTDFDLYKVLNLEGEVEKLFVHDVLDLIYKPNDFQTKTEFMRIFTINMKLSGESFIQMLRDGKGKVTGMVNIRPDIVDVEVHDVGNGPEITYKVYTGGKVLTYTSEEIMHVKFADPENPLRGAGVLRPAYTRITAEQKAMELQKNVFENNGRPDGILSVKGLDSQEAAEKLKKKMKNTFSGKNKDERVAIISSDMTYQQISLSAREMDFIESMKFLRDDILAGLGVPKELVTMEDAGGLNNSDKSLNKFMKFTVEPIVKLFVESLNERMIYPFFDEALLLKHEDLIEEDRPALVKESIELKKAGIISVNTARQQLGYEPEEGHDDLAESTTPTIKMDKVFHGRPYLVKRLKDRAELEQIIKTKIAKEFLTTPTPEFKRLYKRAMNNVTDANVDLMLKETKKYFREQKARMEKKYEALGDRESISVSEIFNLEEEAEATKRLAMQVFPSMAVRSGNAGLTPIKSFYEKVDDFTIDTELIKMIEERAIFFATSVAGVSYDIVGKIVAQGLADGLGRDVVARNIFNAFEDMTRARAKTIAQTEGTYISNLGTQHAFNKEKLVTGKEWISAKDGRVRPEHVTNDGIVVDKDTSFPNGETYPGQHSINCRCVIAPVIRQ